MTISVYYYSAKGLSQVVYIFHKGIMSYVLWGYEVQIKKIILSENPPLTMVASPRITSKSYFFGPKCIFSLKNASTLVRNENNKHKPQNQI